MCKNEKKRKKATAKQALKGDEEVDFSSSLLSSVFLVFIKKDKD